MQVSNKENGPLEVLKFNMASLEVIIKKFLQNICAILKLFANTENPKDIHEKTEAHSN
jgi:hypothetical protein